MAAIKGLEKFSPRDFPGKICATIFLGGCNFKCPYCHNKGLVLDPAGLDDFPLDFFLSWLDSRQDWLEALCVTGGEPLIHKDLEVLLRLIKERGFEVKVDTNGTFPRHLKSLLRAGLVDCVAMDVKAAPDRYREAAGADVDLEAVRESIAEIRDSAPESYFRTTVVPGIVDAAGIEEIGRMVQGARVFQLQQFSPACTLDPSYESVAPYTEDILQEFGKILKSHVAEVRLLGV